MHDLAKGPGLGRGVHDPQRGRETMRGRHGNAGGHTGQVMHRRQNLEQEVGLNCGQVPRQLTSAILIKSGEQEWRTEVVGKA